MIRFFGHFEGDQQTYRGKGEVEHIRAHQDCIKLFTQKVLDAGVIKKPELDAIDEDALAEIDAAVVAAKAAPAPSAKDLMTDVYVTY
jgi:acetoin:2,6-dichlorophenolindophenol oxidoreductase subunit alpha